MNNAQILPLEQDTRGRALSRPDYLLVAPDPANTNAPHPGGMHTASLGLKKYSEKAGLSLAYIDNTQNSFPPPVLVGRFANASWRLLQFLWHATMNRPRKGVLIFAAGPASFLEKGTIGLLARIFRIPGATCLRSGHLMPFLSGSGATGKLIRVMLRAQPRIVVQGESWLDPLKKAGVNMSRVSVVPNWLSTERVAVEIPREAEPSQVIRFIYVGWLVAEKGLLELIEASRILQQSGTIFHLTVVGGGDLEDELNERVQAEGLRDFVTLTGWRKLEDVQGNLAQSDVFVLPTYAEGFPNALLEAFSLGLPAISTAVGGIPDSLEDGDAGFLVLQKNAEALANAMRRYIDDPGLVRQHSIGAIAVVRERHDFQSNCRKLLGTVKL